MRSVVLSLLSFSLCFGQLVGIPDVAFPTLKDYLGLTDQQISSLKKLNNDFSSYASLRQRRLSTVNSELTAEFTKQPPDPYQLGVRYVEVESIRRDVASHIRDLQAQSTAVLTPNQTGLIQTLSTAAVLQSLISDAQCAFLTDLVGFRYISVSSSLMYIASFAIYDPISVIPVLSLPATLPYVPPAPSGTFCSSSTFPISIRQYLSLTDAQVGNLATVSANYNDYYARQQNRMAELQFEIRDETAKDVPDPNALGLRYAELEAIGQDIQNQSTALRTNARKGLTASQTAALKVLQDANNLQGVISQAVGCHLLTLPPGVNYSASDDINNVPLSVGTSLNNSSCF